MSARRPVPGTVARGRLEADVLLVTGEANGQESTELPFPASRAVLARGRQRFDIYCVPCHGRAGYGDGMIVQRGFLPPPSYHIDRLRQAPVGHFFRVMTYGFGAMPQYAKQISAEDRWAIAAYIRALQLSQHAALDDVPPDERARLAAAPAGATTATPNASGASR
jgi:mono/diheme cytochrome c family protein